MDSQGPAFVQKWRVTCREQKAIIDSGNLAGVGLNFQQTLQEISNTQLKMAGQIKTGQLSLPEVAEFKSFLRKGLSKLGSVLISISTM